MATASAGMTGIVENLQPLATPVDELHLLEGNPRVGDVDAVAASLARFGQRKPIVARTDGTVIAGNHTLQAARQLGWTHIAVVRVDDDDATAKAFALADNRTAELGGYDDQALADLIAEVQAADADLLADTGWTDDDLLDLLTKLEDQLPPAGGDPDEVPNTAPAKTVAGDVWLLGPHRLLCGDATVPTDLERVMAGAQADMVWTDPPYGVDYLGKTADALTIQNDALPIDELEALVRSAFTNALDACRPGASWWVATPGLAEPMFVFCKALMDLGIWRHQIIWVKDRFALGRADYHARHEQLLYGWAPGGRHQPTADRTQDTVWEFDRPNRNDVHPTMKPVALIERAIVNHTKVTQTVLDPFGGSGSTLIAAHQTGRVARLVELDPRYCDVICRRYQQLTGDQPISEATGRPHDFEADE